VDLADREERVTRRDSIGGEAENEIRSSASEGAAVAVSVLRIDAEPSAKAPHPSVKGSERRSDLADPQRADSGVPVRKNPKDSLLEMLRALQVSELLGFSSDSGP
jgi:hypothetical protein